MRGAPIVAAMLAACVLVLLKACSVALDGMAHQPPVFTPETVRIVAVASTKHGLTCVEFPNGDRRIRYGVWGQPGDEIAACRTHSEEYWAPPKEGACPF